MFQEGEPRDGVHDLGRGGGVVFTEGEALEFGEMIRDNFEELRVNHVAENDKLCEFGECGHNVEDLLPAVQTFFRL